MATCEKFVNCCILCKHSLPEAEVKSRAVLKCINHEPFVRRNCLFSKQETYNYSSECGKTCEDGPLWQNAELYSEHSIISNKWVGHFWRKGCESNYTITECVFQRGWNLGFYPHFVHLLILYLVCQLCCFLPVLFMPNVLL